MRFCVDAVDAHTQGQHGRVVMGGVGVLNPPGATMFEKMKWFETRADWFRKWMLREPRGYPQSCVNVVLPPTVSGADAGFVIMEQQQYYASMSGTNIIIVATVLLETGMLPITGPVTDLVLEPPAGPIAVRAHCEGGRVRLVEFRNVPSFVSAADVPIEVPGYGRLVVDVAYAGMAKVVVDAKQLGLAITPERGLQLKTAAMAIAAAASEQIGFRHPLNDELNAIESTVLYEIPAVAGGNVRQTSVNIGGTMDRTPAGTGASATAAVLFARGRVGVGDVFQIDGMFGNPFQVRILEETMVGECRAIVPEIGGRAWITAYSKYVLMEDDIFPEGFVVGDLWPMANAESAARKLALKSR
jgi:proline racemase